MLSLSICMRFFAKIIGEFDDGRWLLGWILRIRVILKVILIRKGSVGHFGLLHSELGILICAVVLKRIHPTSLLTTLSHHSTAVLYLYRGGMTLALILPVGNKGSPNVVAVGMN